MIECGETEKLQVLKKVLESVEEVTKFWHVERVIWQGKGSEGQSKSCQGWQTTSNHIFICLRNRSYAFMDAAKSLHSEALNIHWWRQAGSIKAIELPRVHKIAIKTFGLLLALRSFELLPCRMPTHIVTQVAHFGHFENVDFHCKRRYWTLSLYPFFLMFIGFLSRIFCEVFRERIVVHFPGWRPPIAAPLGQTWFRKGTRNNFTSSSQTFNSLNFFGFFVFSNSIRWSTSLILQCCILYDSEEKGEKRPRIGYCDRMNEFRMDDDGREGQNSDMRRQFNLLAASCYQRQKIAFFLRPCSFHWKCFGSLEVKSSQRNLELLGIAKTGIAREHVKKWAFFLKIWNDKNIKNQND